VWFIINYSTCFRLPLFPDLNTSCGSVAMHLRCDWISSDDDPTANLLVFLIMKEKNLKLVSVVARLSSGWGFWLSGHWFEPRPSCCWVAILGKLFTPMCLCHQAVFGTGRSRGINTHIMQCTSAISMVSQHKLMSGWGLWKRRPVPPYGLTWLSRDYVFLLYVAWCLGCFLLAA